MVREITYGIIASVVLTGFAYAMDKKIDARVEQAIRASDESRLEQEIEFYIIKKQTSGLTGEDKINMEIKERQLQKLRAK